MITTRKDRLHEVYEHLQEHHNIHKQSDFAKAIGLTISAMSAAMNGNERYLTDNLFKKICAKYQGVFNLDYLLAGNGELLLPPAPMLTTEPGKSAPPPPVIDPSSMFNAIIAAHNSALATKDELIAAKDDTIASLKTELRSKDELIISLRQQLLQLQQLQRHSPISSYHYPSGVADDKKI